MKYRDLITIFIGILFFLSLGYGLGVNKDLWYLPIIMLGILGFTIWKLWL